MDRSQTNGQDNSRAARNIPFYGQNPFNNFSGGMSTPVAGYNAFTAQNPIANNPMFGRPIWSYVSVVTSPVRGPQPRLARGTGKTGNPSLPGNSALLPGYLTDNEYLPTLDDYSPTHRPEFQRMLPRTIRTGDNGRGLVGTYQPHDFTPGVRWLGVIRQAANWQQMSYPPNNRQLLAWQQVRRYKLQSLTLQARPLQADNYFLGYQVQPQTQAQIGQSTLGYMGG